MLNTYRSFLKTCVYSKLDLSAKSLKTAPSILNKYGLVVIPREVLYPNLNKDLLKSIRISMERIYDLFSEDNFIDELNYKIEYDSIRNEHPSQLARKKISFFSVRDKIFFNRNKKKWTGIDSGLFDFFNPDMTLFQDNLIDYLNLAEKISLKIVQSVNSDYKLNIPYQNLYIYKEVNEPRCLHSDTHRLQYKSFVSLTDIDKIDFGPISYVPKSHKRIGKLRSLLSSFISSYFFSDIGNGKYDAVLFGKQEAIPITTRFLDLVIGNQSCVHGDLPCELNNKIQKILFVNNIFPEKNPK